jgi:hypothetical protein
LTPADQRTASALSAAALKEAKAVREDVLTKVHPGLAAAFEDYVRYVESGRNFNIYLKWDRWWSKNKRFAHFPDDVPVRPEDGLDNEWGRTYVEWQGVRMPRFVPE